MKKIFSLIRQNFESSSGRTPQYLEFHRTFKREFTKWLAELGAVDIQISKPNHFDVSGFFTLRGQTWYFRLEDLRWSKNKLLIRTARDNKDYTGGSNQYAALTAQAAFENDLKYILR